MDATSVYSLLFGFATPDCRPALKGYKRSVRLWRGKKRLCAEKQGGVAMPTDFTNHEGINEEIKPVSGSLNDDMRRRGLEPLTC